MSRRWWVPEVIQTSAMDCGPAALKALLGGHRIEVSYGRLREACQTDVDGTSIDTLEDLALQLGLDAEQNMVPADHVLLPESRCLPCIAVVRLPNGVTHFVVLWRRHGRLVQVMDPGAGRHFSTVGAVEENLYQHQMSVPADAWREFAGSERFLAPLRRRLGALGVPETRTRTLVAAADADPGWGGIAALDAATRLVATLGGTVSRGARAALVADLAAQAREVPDAIPEGFWTVAATEEDEDGTPMLRMKGAVLIRGEALLAEAGAEQAPETLPRELAAALSEVPARPGERLLAMLREDGLLTPGIVGGALFLAAAVVVVQALLLRGLLDLDAVLHTGWQRLVGLGAVVGFLAIVLGLELGVEQVLLRLGRGLDTRLRVAFLRKIPRLGDRYFASRLTSDMAERSHSVHTVRELPVLAGVFLRSGFEIGLTALGLCVLDPALIPLAILSATVSLALPLLAQPVLAERDLRVRSHLGALSRFYLDALRGLVAIRTHGAALAVRREHEGLLVEWARAGLRLQRAVVGFEGAQAATGFALAALLLFVHLRGAAGTGSVLLIVFWALNLPALGRQVAITARLYPTRRNVTLRLLEPLGALEEGVDPTTVPEHAPRDHAVDVQMRGLGVRAGGHVVLHDIDLHIAPGEHVAIVGPSGSGKSSLVGTLLGWHRPAAGTLHIDDAPLDADGLLRLRRETAWVDPSVHLWNRSLLENLHYGDEGDGAVGQAIDQADLISVLERLPEGLQTPLGEGGALVSGGEGQRVRLARALLRDGVRLAVLDEAFRGLDRARRERLLERARDAWADKTLLCITHDVGATRSFPRVVVLEAGTVVEDGSPAALALGDTRYRAMLEAEDDVRAGLWGQGTWRRLRIWAGRLEEEVR